MADCTCRQPGFREALTAQWFKMNAPGLYKYSRTVDVDIQRLRRKVENEPDKPELIVTVAGVGYQ